MGRKVAVVKSVFARTWALACKKKAINQRRHDLPCIATVGLMLSFEECRAGEGQNRGEKGELNGNGKLASVKAGPSSKSP